jgi:hypothetical protein
MIWELFPFQQWPFIVTIEIEKNKESISRYEG